VALGIAHAAATGGSFLGWHAPRPHRVLYLDGYTAPAEMKRRLMLFGPPPDSLQFSLAAYDTAPVRDLTELESQARLMAGWRRPELVVLDDLTSLAGPHGAAERWNALQRFLLLQRRLERAVLLVHEVAVLGDVLDVVLAARRPAEWQASNGARVEIHVEKARGLDGEMFAPIEAALRDGSWHWHYTQPPQFMNGVALLESGLSAEAMGRVLHVSRATAFRIQRRARQLGLVRPAERTEP
jgi:putative DNA primase/helicase